MEYKTGQFYWVMLGSEWSIAGLYKDAAGNDVWELWGGVVMRPEFFEQIIPLGVSPHG